MEEKGLKMKFTEFVEKAKELAEKDFTIYNDSDSFYGETSGLILKVISKQPKKGREGRFNYHKEDFDFIEHDSPILSKMGGWWNEWRELLRWSS